MRVAILPTGRTEWHGFPTALSRLFPDHAFVAVPTPEEIVSNPKGFPYPGFTSNELGDKQRETPPKDLQALIERAAREAVGDRLSAAADLVLILDDVEVVNRGNEQMIVDVTRSAIHRYLAPLSYGPQHRTAKALRERVSFHLLKPMVEGLFFGEAGALHRAGLPAPTAPYVMPSDPEKFETADPAYCNAREIECPGWVNGGSKKKLKPKWIGNPKRSLHPKGYIQWLTRQEEARSCTRYSETEHGAAALAGLDWATVLARPAEQFQYLRALVADLADALNQEPMTGPVSGHQAPLTSRFVLPPDPLLRNL
jgi:hypothetical protein